MRCYRATLFKAATSKKPVSFDEDGVVKTAIPILDSDGRVVAIMMAAPNGAASSGIEKQDMDEVVKVAAVLGTALNNVRKQGFKKAKKRKRDFGTYLPAPPSFKSTPTIYGYCV